MGHKCLQELFFFWQFLPQPFKILFGFCTPLLIGPLQEILYYISWDWPDSNHNHLAHELAKDRFQSGHIFWDPTDVPHMLWCRLGGALYYFLLALNGAWFLCTEELNPPAEGRVHLRTSNQGRGLIGLYVHTISSNVSLPVSREEFCSRSSSCIVDCSMSVDLMLISRMPLVALHKMCIHNPDKLSMAAGNHIAMSGTADEITIQRSSQAHSDSSSFLRHININYVDIKGSGFDPGWTNSPSPCSYN